MPLANLTNEHFKEKETAQLEKYVMSCQSRHRWGKYLMTPSDVSTRRLNNSCTALRCGRIFHRNTMRNLKHSWKNRFCHAALCLTVEESCSRLARWLNKALRRSIDSRHRNKVWTGLKSLWGVHAPHSDFALQVHTFNISFYFFFHNKFAWFHIKDSAKTSQFSLGMGKLRPGGHMRPLNLKKLY